VMVCWRHQPALMGMLVLSCLPLSCSIQSLPGQSVMGIQRLDMGEHVMKTDQRRVCLDGRLCLRGGSGSEVATKRTPYKPSVLRSALTWTGKALTASFSSLLTTSAAMVTFEFTAQKIHPAVADAGMPQSVALLVTVGAVVGSVLGGYVIGKLSPSHPFLLASIVGLIFTAAQYLNLDAVQHPPWFPMAGLLSFVPPYLAAVALTASASPRTIRIVAPPAPKKQASSKAPAGGGKETEGKKGKGDGEGKVKSGGKTPRAKKSSKTPGKTPKSKRT